MIANWIRIRLLRHTVSSTGTTPTGSTQYRRLVSPTFGVLFHLPTALRDGQKSCDVNFPWYRIPARGNNPVAAPTTWAGRPTSWPFSPIRALSIRGPNNYCVRVIRYADNRCTHVQRISITGIFPRRRDLTPGCEWLYFCAVYRTQATFLHRAFQAARCTLLRPKAFREVRFFVKICLRMSLGVTQQIMQQVRAGQSRSQLKCYNRIEPSR